MSDLPIPLGPCVQPGATTEPEAAEEVVAGEEFIMDVQGTCSSTT